MNYFVETLQSSIDGVRTESRLNSTLSDLDLIGKLRKYDLFEFTEPAKLQRKRRKTKSGPKDAYVADAARKRTYDSDVE